MERKHVKQVKDLTLPLEGFARPAQFAYALAVSRATLYNLMRDDPDFPQPAKEGVNITRWPVGAVREYIAKKGGTTLTQACRGSQPMPAS